MIKTRKDLKFYLKEDFKASKLRTDNPFKLYLYRLYGFESPIIFNIIKRFRKYEWAYNNKESLWGKIRYLYLRFRFQRLSIKYSVSLHPNMIGYGFRIAHLGGRVAINVRTMGNYCTVTGGVSLGNKDSESEILTVGNNVEFAVDAKAFGNHIIGNNVRVAPCAVVTHDVPSNCIVGGIPAKIIKYIDPICE